MRTLQDLYVSRCTKTADGTYVPHFWVPQPLQKRPFCYRCRESEQFDSQHDVEGVVQRMIALGLQLELDVGSLVRAQLNKEYPKERFVRELLLSASSDEGRHDQAFRFAEKTYGSKSIDEAAALRKRWVALSDKHHPIAIAGILEQSVFLVTLGLLRIVGGMALADMSVRIAEDEARHVATNVAITHWLKASPETSDEVSDLIAETLYFVIDEQQIPIGPTTLNFDFCLRSSLELRVLGESRTLDRLSRSAMMRMPFENANSSLYTARQTESGQTVY